MIDKFNSNSKVRKIYFSLLVAFIFYCLIFTLIPISARTYSQDSTLRSETVTGWAISTNKVNPDSVLKIEVVTSGFSRLNQSIYLQWKTDLYFSASRTDKQQPDQHQEKQTLIDKSVFTCTVPVDGPTDMNEHLKSDLLLEFTIIIIIKNSLEAYHDFDINISWQFRQYALGNSLTFVSAVVLALFPLVFNQVAGRTNKRELKKRYEQEIRDVEMGKGSEN